DLTRLMIDAINLGGAAPAAAKKTEVVQATELVEPAPEPAADDAEA
ncbi:MAG TPA: hypothetical protein IGS51_16320, partial [Thermoleptolyngbya sp. M55_K2018_002]|nr:hypothetical protein [Thermoleptolyngbya sp. M55_K2018_002]